MWPQKCFASNILVDFFCILDNLFDLRVKFSFLMHVMYFTEIFIVILFYCKPQMQTLKKSWHFQKFAESETPDIFANIYQSPFDSYQVLNIEALTAQLRSTVMFSGRYMANELIRSSLLKSQIKMYLLLQKYILQIHRPARVGFE